jgi:phosphoribosyl-ATP pyrophosphohydrolase/phosphoribosyl-AMP cyclohydrolase
MTPDFKKQNELIPAIIQDFETQKVLMLGFMNKEAFEKTKSENRVTFYSRTKQRLWTKGEESGNFLEVKEILLDCDNDTLLIKAKPMGPTCHTGSDTCWKEENNAHFGFFSTLEKVISERIKTPCEKSYTSELLAKGINKIAQKVGEEAVELVIEAKDNNKELFLNEAADLFFHYLILIKAKGYSLTDVENILKRRQK